MKKPRGFAALTPEQRKAVASMGGKAVKPESRSFSRSKELAKLAGQIGGKSVNPEDRSFSKDSALARAAGAKGGATAHSRRLKVRGT